MSLWLVRISYRCGVKRSLMLLWWMRMMASPRRCPCHPHDPTGCLYRGWSSPRLLVLGSLASSPSAALLAPRDVFSSCSSGCRSSCSLGCLLLELLRMSAPPAHYDACFSCSSVCRSSCSSGCHFSCSSGCMLLLLHRMSAPPAPQDALILLLLRM